MDFSKTPASVNYWRASVALLLISRMKCCSIKIQSAVRLSLQLTSWISVRATNSLRRNWRRKEQCGSRISANLTCVWLANFQAICWRRCCCNYWNPTVKSYLSSFPSLKNLRPISFKIGISWIRPGSNPSSLNSLSTFSSPHSSSKSILIHL